MALARTDTTLPNPSHRGKMARWPYLLFCCSQSATEKLLCCLASCKHLSGSQGRACPLAHCCTSMWPSLGAKRHMSSFHSQLCSLGCPLQGLHRPYPPAKSHSSLQHHRPPALHRRPRHSTHSIYARAAMPLRPLHRLHTGRDHSRSIHPSPASLPAGRSTPSCAARSKPH